MGKNIQVYLMLVMTSRRVYSSTEVLSIVPMVREVGRRINRADSRTTLSIMPPEEEEETKPQEELR